MFPKRGFGLIEMIIYTAILSAVSVFVIAGLLKTIQAFNVYRVNRYINNSGVAAMERIITELRFANNVVTGSSVFDTHPGRLTLDTIDPATEAVTTVEFFASSTELMLKKGSQAAVALTPSPIELTNLVFRQVATTTNPNSKAVKVELELKGKRGNYQKSVKFYSTVVLRGSY